MLVEKDKPRELKLKVQEALQEEAYKGIVRIDAQTMRQIGVRPGDIIEIEGGRTTVGIVDRAYPTDIGQSIIRMDGIIRRNARTGIGELVAVRAANVKEAKSVTIAPAQHGVMIQADAKLFKSGLLGRPIIKGDIVALGGTRSRRRTMTGSPFEDIFDVFEQGFMGNFGFGSLKFIVADATPKEPVIITENTEIKISSKAIEVSEETSVPEVTYEDIGGLEDEVKKLREMVELPLRHPEIFERLGVEPPKGVLLHGPPGCLTGDTLVALEDGRLVRMEEIGKNLIPGIHIADLPIYPPASAKAVHVYDVPETVEVILKRGKRIRMTPNHPLMTNDGWKEAEKLKIGDKVKTLNWIPSPMNYVPINFIPNEKRIRGHCVIPAIWNERLALLLGIFVAEGSIEKWRIKFTINKKEKELRETIIDLISKLFEVEVRELPDLQKNALRLRFSHRYLEDFFRRFWQKQKMIPTPILLSTNSVAANFLKGLFEGDGSVVKNSPRYDRCITLKSTSRRLVEESQILLLRWSIRSSIHEYISKLWGKIYTLKISGKSNLLKFRENIGFLSNEKKEKLDNLIVSYKLSTTSEDISEYEPIKEIKRIQGWQRVYDFEVPATHSFFSNGILSHNTGKTLIAKAVANESEANFILVNGPELTSKFYGETEKRVREVFQEAEKNAPSIIFIDEIDSVAPKRDETYGEVERRMVSQMLAMMDGLKSRGKVIVIGATNRPNSLDPALRRPGRFDREISVGVPNVPGRLEILKIHTRNMPIAHFDPHVLINMLKNKVASFEEEKELEIKEIQTKIDNYSIKLNKELNPELKRLQEELKELELIKKQSKYSDLEKILHRLGLKQSEILSLKEQIEKLNNNIDNAKSNINSLEKEIALINKRKDEFNTDSRLYDKIAVSLAEKMHSKEALKPEDPRNIFVQTSIDKDYEKIDQIQKELYSTKILSNDFIVEVKKGSVLKLLKVMAEKTHGFVGADLSALTKETAMNVLRRLLPDLNLKDTKEIPKEILDKLIITENDFKDALKIVRPSAMREVYIESPNIKYNDIGGLLDLKQELKEAVEWPLRHPQVFSTMGIRAPRGILLYGPPGTGKTLIAKAVANESEANFIYIKGPELISKWMGESEKGIRKIFEKARQASPCIIFFDEIDAIAHSRDFDEGSSGIHRVVNQMLTEMDGLQELNDVVVIAATNRIDLMDTGLLRPGRFDKILTTNVPDEEARESIFNIHIKNMPIAKDVDVKVLAQKTENYVGADIEAVCREAALLALRKNIKTRQVEMSNFEEALEKIKPSIKEEDIKRYKEIEENYIRTARAAIQKVPNYLG